MTPERWAGVQDLFERAVVLPVHEREPFVARESGPDTDLAALVSSMLVADASDNGDLHHAVGRAIDHLAPPPVVPAQRLGPYRVIREIGKGGMGTVYLAERDDHVFEQRVAIKVVRGLLDDERVRRFRAERQILATLDHPNIARLLDGGATDEGSPYLVMEYVEGEPIDRYCLGAGPIGDASPPEGAVPARLPLRDRLALFITICDAVSHAHRHLVVHRDLKPTNILVTPAGVPKLLDFGIAKLLDDDAETNAVTMTGMRLLTPDYAAPEQARGERITTATDVYALGVLLFELLTGRRPYTFTTRVARDIERIICDTEPPRPGTITPLDPDLDVIVLTALQKEPSQRYASVDALAEDIRRHMQGLPIEARPSTWRYRAGRFAARHRWGVGAAAAATVLLVGFSAVVSVQAARIAAERDAAERERDTSKEVSNFLVQLFEVSDPDEARGNSVTARELLDRGADRIDRELASQPVIQSRLMQTIGQVYRSLGLFERSDDVLTKTLTIREKNVGRDTLDAADTIAELGEVARNRGQFERAETLHREALAIRQAHLGPVDRQVAFSLTSVGLALHGRGRYKDAEPFFRQAIEMWRQTLPPNDPQIAVGLNNLAILMRRTSRFAEAEPLLREALAIRQTAFEGSHGMVANSLMQLGQLLNDLGQLAEAEPFMRDALTMQLELYGRLHPYVAVSYSNLASLLHDQGKLKDAEALYRESVSIAAARVGTAHPDYAVNINNLASLLEDRGAYAEAEPLFRQALAIREKTYGAAHPAVARGLNNLGRVLAQQGQLAEGARLAEQGQDMRRKIFGDQHVEVAAGFGTLGLVRLKQRRLDEAERMHRTQLDILRALLPPDHPNIASSQIALAAVLRERGLPADAEPLARESLATRERKLPAGHWHRAYAQCVLARILEDSGNTAEASALDLKGRSGLSAALGPDDARIAAACGPVTASGTQQ